MVDPAHQSNNRASIVALDRIDPDRNAFRYYVLSIEPTLFEEAGLVQEWGRIGQRGRQIVELCPAAAAAKVELDTGLFRKRRRGYVDFATPVLHPESRRLPAQPPRRCNSSRPAGLTGAATAASLRATRRRAALPQLDSPPAARAPKNPADRGRLKHTGA